ncbi:MAG: SCP2 sterol-binding domain-containing protein [Steroidobacteraceae bacterium]|nr:SCP2 sterol-binding domain-containing protein [Steroidobacteraceae bacterium]
MLLERLEEALNRNVAESRKAQALCRQLDGRVVSLAVTGTPLEFFASARDGRLSLSPKNEGAAADASLSGSPISLLSLAGPRAEGALRGGGVRIEGDAEVAQKFRELLEHAQPDAEEELARVVGDVAARNIANLARGFLDFGRKAGRSLAGNVSEYLQEEGRDLPTRTEAEEFLADVDRLRDDVERFEARLARVGSPGAKGGVKRRRLDH